MWNDTFKHLTDKIDLVKPKKNSFIHTSKNCKNIHKLKLLLYYSS